MKKLVGVLILLMAVANATYLNIDEPVAMKGMTENSAALNIGVAGPGQTVYIIAERSTVGPDGKYYDIGWDKLEIHNAPPGWTTEDSLWYETPMEAKIRISPDAANGTYTFQAVAVNAGNLEGLGNITVNISVTVSTNVFSVDVVPQEVETGVGEPAIYNVEIDNAGAASDTFKITSTDVPEWRFTKDVVVPHAIDTLSPARTIVPYELVSNQEANIDAQIIVTSLSSDQLVVIKKVKLDTTPSLVSDYRATDDGLMVFPLIEGPVYALIAFISKMVGL